MPIDTGTWAIIFVALVIAVVIGGAKLPGIMRNVGRSLGHYKLGLAEGEAEVAKFKETLKAPEPPK